MGSPREGRAVAIQTGPGQGHKTCPYASRSEWPRAVQAHPFPSQGCSRGPPEGLEALPCHGNKHMVERGTGGTGGQGDYLPEE